MTCGIYLLVLGLLDKPQDGETEPRDVEEGGMLAFIGGVPCALLVRFY